MMVNIIEPCSTQGNQLHPQSCDLSHDSVIELIINKHTNSVKALCQRGCFLSQMHLKKRQLNAGRARYGFKKLLVSFSGTKKSHIQHGSILCFDGGIELKITQAWLFFG